MSTKLTSDQVWQAIENELFAVVGMVSARNEARTAGVMYALRDRKLYFVSDKDAWKVRHIAQNPHLSVTIPIAKRVFFMPWIKIPAATITFCATARVLPAGEVPPELLRAVLRQMADDPEVVEDSCLVELAPKGEFVTYGVGVSLMEMRDTEKARGRAPVDGLEREVAG
jgi:hypothetical protein